MRIEQSEFHDHLVRGLTHRMNNILSLFHGYLGLLMDDKKLDPETLAGLVHIRDGADAASKLMDRTKALATPSSTIWRQIAPDEFFKSLLPAFQLHSERGVQLQVDCPPGLPDLWADIPRLRVALKELVKNAYEASPSGGVVQIAVKSQTRALRISAKRRTETPAITWVAICITDTGKGIPADLQSKIFQPFFSTKCNRDSLGLGLSVALGLVQQLGGAIRYLSKPGRTTVKVLLPSRAAAADAAAA